LAEYSSREAVIKTVSECPASSAGRRRGDQCPVSSLTLKFFLITFLILPYTLHVARYTGFADEPIILPPVTITGQDKSTDLFDKPVKSPRPAAKNLLPKGSMAKEQQASASFFTIGLYGGGYDYLEWKVTGGRQAGIGFLLLLDRIKTGDYGVNSRLQNYSADNFNADFSVPFFLKSSIFSSLKYYDRNEGLTHPALLAAGGNILNHWTRNADVRIGWKGNFGNLSIIFTPGYSSAYINDRMPNVNTAVLPAATAEEVRGGAKLGISAQFTDHAVAGEVQYEYEERKSLSRSGGNFSLSVEDKFRIAGIPEWRFRAAARYLRPYRFIDQFILNPEVDVSCEMKNGMTMDAGFRRTSVLPGYAMFLGNFTQFNPGLGMEHSWDINAGVRGRFNSSDGKFSGFWDAGFYFRIIQDFIAYGDTDTLWQPFNIPLVTHFGPAGNIGVRYQLFGGDIVGKAGFTHREIVSSEMHVPYLARDEFTYSIGYEIGRFEMQVAGNYRGPVYSDTQTNAREIPGYFMTGLNTAFNAGDGIRLYFNIENLADVFYESMSEYPCRGRNFRGGVELKF